MRGHVRKQLVTGHDHARPEGFGANLGHVIGIRAERDDSYAGIRHAGNDLVGPTKADVDETEGKCIRGREPLHLISKRVKFLAQEWSITFETQQTRARSGGLRFGWRCFRHVRTISHRRANVLRQTTSISENSHQGGIMTKYVLAFFSLALLLSACRIESNILLDISEDGSAVVGAEIGFDEEMLDLVSQAGGDPADILDELPDLGGDGVEPITRVEGDMTYFGATTKIDNLSTYDFDGFQGETFSEFSYEFDDSSATLAAKVDATGIGDLAGGDLPIDPSAITGEVFSARVLVTMPGTVAEHNADEILSDGTLVWNLPLTGTKDIFATSTFGGSGFNGIWLVVGGILIVGIIAAIAAVMASRKDSEKAVAEAAARYEESQSTDVEDDGRDTTDGEPEATDEAEDSNGEPDRDATEN